MLKKNPTMACLSVLTALFLSPALVNAAAPRVGGPKRTGAMAVRIAPRSPGPSVSAIRGFKAGARAESFGAAAAFDARIPPALPATAVRGGFGAAPAVSGRENFSGAAFLRNSEALSAKAEALSEPLKSLSSSPGRGAESALGAAEESSEVLGSRIWAIATGDGTGRTGPAGKPVVTDLALLSPSVGNLAVGLVPTGSFAAGERGRPGGPESSPAESFLDRSSVAPSAPTPGGVRLVVMKVAGLSLIFSSVAAEPARRLALAAVLSAARPAPGREAPRAFAGLPMPAGAAFRNAGESRRDAAAVSVSEPAVRGESELYRFHAVSPAASAPSAGAMSPARAASPLRAAAVTTSADWNAASAGGISSAAAPALLLSGLFSCLVLAAASLREFVG